jgi:hypothetical protein
VTGTVLGVGQTSQFTAKAKLSNGTTQDITTQATWQSSNTAVATVSAAGLVTVQAFGSTDISASYQSVTGRVSLSVAVTVTSVQVGAAGNASTMLPPGQTLQLWALAKYSDGTASDVTNLSVWQSSNPVVATVSSEGTLRTAAEGEVDVFAMYQKVQGGLHAVVRKPGCEATTLSPSSLTFNAFGHYSSWITVTTPLSDCYWTAQSDASWLKFKFDPGRSGSGDFTYEVHENNYPNPRTAHIVVSVTGGTHLTHTVYQEQPLSCSYVVTPTQGSFTANGGSGFFDVITTPANCSWTATSEYGLSYGVQLTGATNGTGSGRVTYSVASSFRTYPVDNPIQVAGLSGTNPPATYTVHIAAR